MRKLRDLAIALFALAPACYGAAAFPMPAELCARAEDVARAARAVTAKDYPDADTVILDDRIHTSYAPDGAYVTWDDEWVKVLTEKGRRQLALVTLDYSARYGDAAIACLEILGTNGVVRKVDFARTLKVATDNASTAANIYDPLSKTLSAAVSGLAVGETRHVRFYRREFKPRMKGAWADVVALEDTRPIRHTVVTVDAPAALPLRHAAIRHPFGKSVTRLEDRPLGGGLTRMGWELLDVPQVFPEPAMPPWARAVQTLRLSTVPDWPAVSRWYAARVAPHLARTTPGMTNKVAELTGRCASPAEKVRALFTFVSQEIRYMGLTDETEREAPGYEPHDVSLTFEKRYGVCRDKAALLVAMLRLAGFDARTVLIHAGCKMDDEIPSPYFNHAIVGVKNPPGAAEPWQLMDPTDERARDLLPAYLSDCSYLVADAAGEPLRTSPVAPVAHNLLRITSSGTLSPEGAALMEVEMAFGGINDTALRHLFARKTEEARRRTLEGIFRRVAAGAELLSATFTPADVSDTETPLAIRATVRYPEAVLRGETRDTLRLPVLMREFSVVKALLDDNTALVKRRFPLLLDTTAGVEEHLSLRVDEALGAPLSLPAAVCAGACTPHAFSYALGVTNGIVTATGRQEVRKLEFSVPAYERLRDDLKVVEAAWREDPVFHAVSNRNADTRIFLNRREIVFSSPRQWVETNTVVKEVLTYQGKKGAAELRFSFNPLVRSVTLVSASVSNRSGRVQHVTPKEMHLLDCDWAARAPRYPAGRRLIVNLPGVEIGSVIRYTLAQCVTNAPLAFTSFTAFDSTQPLERLTVKVSLPEEMPFEFRTTGFDRPFARSLEDRANGRRRLAWTVWQPPRCPNEPHQPPASLWRPTLFMTAADWPDHAARFLTACAAARTAKSDAARQAARACAAGAASPEEAIAAVRRFLAHRVRTVGPGIFELPFDRAFTPPDRVLEEGYASRADRCNVTHAMLEALGFKVDLLFAADDATSLGEVTRLYEKDYPRPDFFNAPVLRAEREGRVFYLAGENEYAPAACSSREGDSFFDPGAGEFGKILLDGAVEASWYRPWTWWGLQAPVYAAAGASVHAERDENVTRLLVREDGGVDFDVTNRTWGAGVGAFRKRFAEMLPERRSRLFQTLLGRLAQSAAATRELVTDTAGYPAELSFAAFVPDFAVRKDDALTVCVPDFDEGILPMGEEVRRSPLFLEGCAETVDTCEVVFPRGFTAIEHLPEPYALKHPKTGEDWVVFTVVPHREGERLTVTLSRRVFRRAATVWGADYAPFFRAWNRRMTARAGRTLQVRRRACGKGGAERALGPRKPCAPAGELLPAWRGVVDDASAAAVVKGAPNQPAVSYRASGTKGCVELPVESAVDRVRWDFLLPCDLSAHEGLAFDFRIDDLSVLRNATVYLKSGEGWYTGSLPIEEEGAWQHMRLTRANLKGVSGKPAGWHRIDAVRLTLVRTAELKKTRAAVADFRYLSEAEAEWRAAEKTQMEERARQIAASVPARPGERRFAWSHGPAMLGPSYDWDTTVKRLKETGFTDVIPLFSWGCRAYYASKVLPEDASVARTGDGLAACLAACRKYGLKCHVWRISYDTGNRIDPARVAAFEKAGRLVKPFAPDIGNPWKAPTLCPSHPENIAHEIAAMEEVADRGVDGIHFDYIRYANRDFCFCDGCRARFEKTLGKPVANWPADVRADAALEKKWTAWRAGNVSRVVAAVAAYVRARHPGMEISLAARSSIPGAYAGDGQDWVDWAKKGWVDVICPMDYTPLTANFRYQFREQARALVGTRAKLYPGIGLNVWPKDGGDAERLARQIRAVRAEGFGGFAVFCFNMRAVEALAPLCDVRPSH